MFPRGASEEFNDMKKRLVFFGLLLIFPYGTNLLAKESESEKGSPFKDLYLASFSEEAVGEASKVLLLTRVNGQFLTQERFMLESKSGYAVMKLFTSRPDIKDAILNMGNDRNNVIEFVVLWQNGKSYSLDLDTVISFSLNNDYATRNVLGSQNVMQTRPAKKLFGEAAVRGISCEFGCDDEWDDCIGYTGGQDPAEVEFCDWIWLQCWENCDSDDDTVINRLDNCVYAANTNQSDCDGDGKGDACDNDNTITEEFWGEWQDNGTHEEYDCVAGVCPNGDQIVIFMEDSIRYRYRRVRNVCTGQIISSTVIQTQFRKVAVSSGPAGCC